MSFETPARAAVASVARYWWLFLVTGVLWFIIGLMILQYDVAATGTVGYIVGFMLLFTGIQQFFLAAVGQGWSWVWVVFGIIFVLGGIWAILNPFGTAYALAMTLGLLFLLIGIFWVVEAVVSKDANPLWWLGLVSGIIMGFLAYWVAQQDTLARLVTLLTFAGVWALLQAVTDIIRAFRLKSIREAVA